MTFRTRSVHAPLVMVAALGALLVAPSVAVRAADPEPFRATEFAVATDHASASRAAAEVLAGGGNAADAAAAAALALGVVNPSSSALGGGGFATICSPRGECSFLDFREVAPAALTREMLSHASDPATASQIGGLAVAVPGEPMGLLTLVRRFGHAPMTRVVAPAVRLARSGFSVSAYLADRIRLARDEIARDATLSALFLPAGAAAVRGATVRRPVLARTLERYAREGEHFVRSEFAEAVARRVTRAGGVLTSADLAQYAAAEREPLRRTFRDWTVVTSPPPSAGGLILLESLDLVAAAPTATLQHGSSAYDHLLAESWRGGFDDRSRYVGDPASGGSTVDALLDPQRLARRRAAFDASHAGTVVVNDPAHDHGTSHVCVVDRDGMMVSLTTTVNLQFGARIDVPELDVVLDDEIDDFSLGTPGNNYGIAFSAANALAAGRRPVSSMAPTIVLRGGRPIACIGASGGSRIPTATTQVLLDMFVFGMDPRAAIDAPRVHHQGNPNVLLVDPEVPEDVRAALRARGHDVRERDGVLGVAQALLVREHDGTREILAASDPRKGGEPAGR